jgi:MFS transporter, DHA3 family, macrolide efflux protein
VFVLAPLRKRPVALLWFSQLLTSIGEELFRIALIWLAADLIGGATGYILATQQVMIFAVSAFGGVLVDRWNSRKAMVSVDCIRALALLIVPATALASGPQVWTLFFAAGTTWGLRGLHGPALQALVPRVAPSPDMLLAMNALLDGTRRIARIAGPGVAGLIALVSPIEHFFTIVAVIFTLSAVSVAALKALVPDASLGSSRTGWRVVIEEFAEPMRALRGNRLMVWAFVAIGITNAFWNAALVLGLVLVIHERLPGDIGAYGLVFSAYGVGNLVATLAIGSMRFGPQMLCMFPGRAVLGLGFIGLAAAPSLPVFMMIAPLAAIGGTMGDLPFLGLMQREFDVRQIGRIYGLRVMIESAGGALGAVIAALALAVFAPATVVAMCGAGLVLLSALSTWGTRSEIARRTRQA